MSARTYGFRDNRIPPAVGLYVVRAIALVVRFGLGGLFIMSAVAKIQTPYDFLSAVYNYELTSPILGLSVAMALPWLELVLGVSLVAGILDNGAMLLSVVLLLVFFFVRLSAFSRDLLIPCGCASRHMEVITLRDVIVSVLLVFVALIGLLSSLASDVWFIKDDLC